MKRDITLMLYVDSREDKNINELKEFCKVEGILIKNTDFRSYGKSVLYDFIIEGSTLDYNKLVDKFGDRLTETYYAELGNILDVDNEHLEKWKNVVERYKKHAMNYTNLFEDFCNLIKDIEEVYKLEHLLNYQFDDFSKNLIKDRISQIKGEKIEWERWIDNCLEKQELIKKLKLVKEGKQSLNNDDLASLIKILGRVI